MVRRLKGGESSTHPLQGGEIRELRKLRRDWGDGSGYVFCNERGSPVSAAGFRKTLARIAADAGLGDLKIHPHCLRHSCGFALVERGLDIRLIQAWLGHREIRHTIRYAMVSLKRFEDVWR